tara:strand:+ start:41 stop:580 length:540 start_codon:yes stop_codon:yes gene_type:complete
MHINLEQNKNFIILKSTGIPLETLSYNIKKNYYLLHLSGGVHIFGNKCSESKNIKSIYREKCWPWIEVIKGRYLGQRIGTVTKRDPYPKLNLAVEGERIKRAKGQMQTPIKTFYFHRLVCMAAHANPNNLPSVDHINDIPVDYRSSNLRWVSISDNNRAKRARINYDKLYDTLQIKTFV